MRRVFMLVAALGVLALAGCGGASKTSTSSAGASASTTSTTATSRGGITTVARAPTKRGSATTPTAPHGPTPAIPAITATCRNLPQPAAGPAGALRLRDGLQPSIDSLSAFVGTRAPGKVALSERLRAASVLRAMRGAQSAAARYVASPTSANEKALSAAVLLEGSTAQAETLPACTIPGA